ncbi:Inner membrane protein YghB [Rubripirellula lacrimiformis]|uniref:Inner membrane protein YghB n=1 Tax=Rubripirellula lacrimiformis TaxID=1930273 RepID=A0A517NIT7_9BACT|nr:DedA family protein [Rubripirellula lacrimiformis]QDT07049.1 Inner membrane protein YghB [Rubripirellula lacrimiformis]
MDHWIRDVLEQFGVIGVGALMLAENVFPPIPSEVVMPWAGYSVSQGDASFLAVVAAGSTGSFAGAMLWYVVGRWIGKQKLSSWIEGHGAWLTIAPRDLDRVDQWFASWGSTAVLVCRLIPGLRTLISVPAGFAEMPLGRFAAFTAIGTVLWTTLLAGIGYWLGDNYGDLAGPLGWISTFVIVVTVGWWLVRLTQQRARRTQ